MEDLGGLCVVLKIINKKPGVIAVHLASIIMLQEILRSYYSSGFISKEAVNESVWGRVVSFLSNHLGESTRTRSACVPSWTFSQAKQRAGYQIKLS